MILKGVIKMDHSIFHGDIVSSSRILYTPSSFARKNLLHLQETGTLQAEQPHTSRREGLSSLLFFIVLSGEGNLEYENTTYTLRPGDCVFLDCASPYAHHTSRKLWQLRWVHFYGEAGQAIYDKYRERGGACHFTPENPTVYASLLSEIHSIAESHDYIRDMLLCEKLTSLLTMLMKETTYEEGNEDTGKRKNLLEVKEYLDAHFQEKISLDDLAGRFYINKFYLTRLFKDQFGTSVHSYLAGLRITRGKHLLRFTDLTMEEIAAQCGFGDGNYFVRTFKKIEGITPGDFRKSWRS